MTEKMMQANAMMAPSQNTQAQGRREFLPTLLGGSPPKPGSGTGAMAGDS